MAEESDLAGKAKSIQPTDSLTAGGTTETGVADRGKVAGSTEQGITRPGQPLTTRQKRFFVLGIETSEKQ